MPPPADLPNLGIEQGSPALQEDSLPTSQQVVQNQTNPDSSRKSPRTISPKMGHLSRLCNSAERYQDEKQMIYLLLILKNMHRFEK